MKMGKLLRVFTHMLTFRYSIKFPLQNQKCFYRAFSKNSQKLVLGIESSCDDTGAAVVDDTGYVLGEGLHSQKLIHLANGGIIPPVARDLHQKHVANVVKTALDNAQVTLNDLDAIAVTVKPGLALSLLVGMKYAKQLATEFQKPLIPIHHMEAHALTVRMLEKIDFPFLTLLISGGHCLLCVVKALDEFIVLGSGVDDAPGEAFDKTARRLKLNNLPEFSNIGGGESIELAARNGNPLAFNIPLPMASYQNCDFSFAGLKTSVKMCIIREEVKQDISGGSVISNYSDICASFQWIVTRHILQRLHRGIIYAKDENLIPNDNQILVVSGGVASNIFIRTALTKYCERLFYKVVFPPPKLCSDNGVMIAWNGMERLIANIGVLKDFQSVDIQAQSPLGISRSFHIMSKQIKLPSLKFKPHDVIQS